MPKIPFAPAQKEEPFVPGAEPDVQSAGLPGAALARAAQNAASGLEQYGTVDLYLKRAEKVIKLSTARLDLDNDLHELKKRYEMDTDYTNMPQKYATERQALIEKYQNQLGGEQDVWKAFEPTLNAKLDYTGTDVTYMARKGFIAESRATAIDNYERGVKRYAQTQDPRDRDNLLIDLENARQVGLFKPDEVRKMRDGIDNRAEVFKVEMMIEKNPKAAFDYLSERTESGQYVNGQALDIEQRAKFIKSSNDQVRMKQNQFYADQNRYQEEVRYRLYDMLDSKAPARDVIKFINDQTQVDPNTGFRGLDPREAYALKEKVRNGAGEGGATNFVVWQNLYKKGLDGKLTHDDILRSWGNGLSTSDAKQLSTMLTKGEQKGATARTKEVDHLVAQSMTQFSTYAKAVIGESKKETSKDLASAVIYDVQQVSQFVTDKSDMKWFEDYQKKSVTQALANNNKKYLQKYIERLGTSNSYDKMFEGTAPGARKNVPSMPPNTGDISQKVSETFGDQASTMLAVMSAESTNRPGAVNTKNANGTSDHGLFQINDVNIPALQDAGIIRDKTDLYDADTNIRAAKYLFDRDGLAPWRSSVEKWGRPAAIAILRANGKVVNDDTISKIMQQFPKPPRKRS